MKPLLTLLASAAFMLALAGVFYSLSNAEYDKELRSYTPALIVFVMGLMVSAMAGLVVALHWVFGQPIVAPQSSDQWMTVLRASLWNALATLCYFTAYPLGGDAVMNTSIMGLIPAGACLFLFLCCGKVPKVRQVCGVLLAMASALAFAAPPPKDSQH